jgi:hypothetical protein
LRPKLRDVENMKIMFTLSVLHTCSRLLVTVKESLNAEFGRVQNLATLGKFDYYLGPTNVSLLIIVQAEPVG